MPMLPLKLNDPIDPANVEEIIEFIPRLQEIIPDRVTIRSPGITEDSGELILEMHGEYHPLIQEFMDALYRFGFVRDFDWPVWQKYAEGLWKHPECLKTAKILTCVKLLTTHARKDRFCDGHFAAMVACGHITAILTRMETLLHSSGERWQRNCALSMAGDQKSNPLVV